MDEQELEKVFEDSERRLESICYEIDDLNRRLSNIEGERLTDAVSKRKIHLLENVEYINRQLKKIMGLLDYTIGLIQESTSLY